MQGWVKVTCSCFILLKIWVFLSDFASSLLSVGYFNVNTTYCYDYKRFGVVLVRVGMAVNEMNTGYRSTSTYSAVYSTTSTCVSVLQFTALRRISTGCIKLRCAVCCCSSMCGTISANGNLRCAVQLCARTNTIWLLSVHQRKIGVCMHLVWFFF